MSDMLRRGAFLLMMVFAMLAVPFSLLQIMEDPGGLLGVVITVLVLAPLVVLSYLAAVRPRTTCRWLAIAVGVLAVYVVAEAMSPSDPIASVLAIGTVVLAVPLAVLGLRETRDAGALLVLDGSLPIVSLVLLTTRQVDDGAAPQQYSSAVAAGMPVFMVGALFLLAWALRPRHL